MLECSWSKCGGIYLEKVLVGFHTGALFENTPRLLLDRLESDRLDKDTDDDLAEERCENLPGDEACGGLFLR